MELAKVISIVLGAIASAAKKPLQRNKLFIKALKKCGLEPEHLPAEFSAVYNYALVEYALADEAGKLESLLKLFAEAEVREAFKQILDTMHRQTWAAFTNLIGKALSKFEEPLSARFIAERNAPIEHRTFDIEEA